MHTILVDVELGQGNFLRGRLPAELADAIERVIGAIPGAVVRKKTEVTPPPPHPNKAGPASRAAAQQRHAPRLTDEEVTYYASCLTPGHTYHWGSAAKVWGNCTEPEARRIMYWLGERDRRLIERVKHRFWLTGTVEQTSP
jgi:hypothetical protein